MELYTKYYDENLVLKRAVDIALPKRLSRRTALFYVHGGGWSAGARDIFHEHLQYFSRRGYVCASAGYRLAPSVRLAEQMKDVIAGYDTFIADIRARELPVDRIVVLGSSAGAHLVSLLALTGPDQWNGGAGLRGPWLKPAACVSINGPGTMEQWDDMNADIRKSIEEVIGAAYGEETEAFRKASPMTYVDENAPDFLFLIVGKEEYFPHAYVYEMSGKLQKHGKHADVVLFPEAEHGFFYGVDSEHQQEALKVLEPFLERYG